MYLTPELRAGLADQLAKVHALERELGRIIPHVFPALRGPRKGEQRKSMSWTWRQACKRAGLWGKWKHDLRRTAVRDMVNAGISERVAMTISGHRTRSVFDRYHIVTPSDLRDATRKMADKTDTREGTRLSQEIREPLGLYRPLRKIVASAQQLDIVGGVRRTPPRNGDDVIEVEVVRHATHDTLPSIALPDGDLNRFRDAPPWSRRKYWRLFIVLPIHRHEFEFAHLSLSVALLPRIHQVKQATIQPKAWAAFLVDPHPCRRLLSQSIGLCRLVKLGVLGGRAIGGT